MFFVFSQHSICELFPDAVMSVDIIQSRKSIVTGLVIFLLHLNTDTFMLGAYSHL